VQARQKHTGRFGNPVRHHRALMRDRVHLRDLEQRFTAFVDASRFCRGDALQLPFRRKFVSNSAKTPSMSRKHLPAAVLVSIANNLIRYRYEPHDPAGARTRLADHRIITIHPDAVETYLKSCPPPERKRAG
jgi:hypothetical protein